MFHDHARLGVRSPAIAAPGFDPMCRRIGHPFQRQSFGCCGVRKGTDRRTITWRASFLRQRGSQNNYRSCLKQRSAGSAGATMICRGSTSRGSIGGRLDVVFSRLPRDGSFGQWHTVPYRNQTSILNLSMTLGWSGDNDDAREAMKKVVIWTVNVIPPLPSGVQPTRLERCGTGSAIASQIPLCCIISHFTWVVD